MTKLINKIILLYFIVINFKTLPNPTERDKLIEDDTATIESTLEKLNEENAHFINFIFTDIIGNLKEITIPVAQAKNYLENGLIFNSKLQYSKKIKNLILKPDLTTIRFLPWTDDIHKTAFFVCNIYKTHTDRYDSDSRFILQKIYKELKEYNLQIKIGIELEFFIFSKNNDGSPTLNPCDQKKYLDPEESFVRQQESHIILHTLKGLGINIERFHRDIATGQRKLVMQHDDLVKTADQLIIAKYALQVIAQQLGYHISFMPKPFSDQKGNDLIVNFYIRNLEKQNYILLEKEAKLSKKIYNHFFAGILQNIKNFSPLLNPTINSYKRLNNERIYIGIYRTQNPEEKHFKLSMMDPLCNPYLAFASIIKMGIEGLKNKLVLNKEIEENSESNHLIKLDSLQNNLEQALNDLEKNNLTEELMSKNGLRKYIKIKRKEWNEFNKVTTDWEQKKYL